MFHVRRHLFRASLTALAFVSAVGWSDVPGQRTPTLQTSSLTAEQLWLAPVSRPAAASSALADAVTDLGEDRAERAVPVFARHAADPVLGGYALLYLGRAHLALHRLDEAAATAKRLLSIAPTGHLGESAHWLAVDTAEARADSPGAVLALQTLAGARPVVPARVYLRLGRAAVNAGDRPLALESLRKVYYEFPLTPEAADAAEDLDRLLGSPAARVADRPALELARAHQLFDARRYADAQKAFELLRGVVRGEDRTLLDLRLAECDYYLKRYVPAREALRTYLDRSTGRRSEAQFFYFSTLRELGRHDEYETMARAFVDNSASDSHVEEALNNLGTHFILIDDDAKAATVFAELYARFPTGSFGDRAAWKAGWWAYKKADYAETIRIFETAAVTYRRADYRPSWLYWAARARGRVGDRTGAADGFRAVIADYRNSYYGRQAARELETIAAATRPAGAGPVSPVRHELPPTIVAGTPPTNAVLIRRLLDTGLYDAALSELRRLQTESGPSPYLDATIAYALNRRGDLRPGITAMRRAYPQFMAAGGEALPREILTVIFPLDYWPLIQKHAAARSLDPYLVAALVAQESTFDAGVRSAANAWGLMQIVPATGRRVAQTLGIRPFSTARLTEPEVNVRIGTSYLADLIKEFGDLAPALASYNAGEHRVRDWIDDRRSFDADEFIDDIPFPETQNYVKRILGTAEDYRILYGALRR